MSDTPFAHRVVSRIDGIKKKMQKYSFGVLWDRTALVSLLN